MDKYQTVAFWGFLAGDWKATRHKSRVSCTHYSYVVPKFLIVSYTLHLNMPYPLVLLTAIYPFFVLLYAKQDMSVLSFHLKYLSSVITCDICPHAV